MQASVIISYYKNLAQLQVLLSALNAQTALGSFEVIISETEKNATLITIFDKSEKENIPTATLKSILAQEGLD